MNLSPATIALVPPGVVTLISTVPAARAGEVMVRVLSSVTCRSVPGVVPNMTVVTPVNPVPVIVTAVPPVAGPLAGEMLVTVGTGTYVNVSSVTIALVPLGVVTRTSIVPVPAGEVAVRLVAELYVTLAATLPNETVDALVNPVPVIVTIVPPATGPLAGEMLVIVGIPITVIVVPGLVVSAPLVLATVSREIGVPDAV